jgi:putative DNA primase/helicase
MAQFGPFASMAACCGPWLKSSECWGCNHDRARSKENPPWLGGLRLGRRKNNRAGILPAIAVVGNWHLLGLGNWHGGDAMNAALPVNCKAVELMASHVERCIENRLRAAGIVPAEPLNPTPGKIARFRVEGDRRGTANGWCIVFDDGAGAAGHWKTGIRTSWGPPDGRSRDLSRAQRAALHREMQAKIAQREAEQQRQFDAAAKRAAALWNRARPADPEHAYLRAKGIEPGPARQWGDALVLPIVNTRGEIRSLQFIAPDGAKRLLAGAEKRGHFIVAMGDWQRADVIAIAEGFATAMSAGELLAPDAMLAAIDAGNLLPVAEAVRAARPDAHIIIAADDDRTTPGNPGLTKAREAARAVGGEVIRPRWPDGALLTLSDFNDLTRWVHQQEGARHD